MVELTTVVNPPQAVFDQIVHLTSETEDWSNQVQEYKFWKANFDNFWLYTVVEKNTQKLVASVTLARWDDPKNGPLYSVGLFYCTQKYRGQGHAKPLFDAIMKIVGDNNACLYGAVKMSEKYAKVYGFNQMPSFWHYYGKIEMADLKIPDIPVSGNLFVVKNWQEVAENELAAYDLTICPRNRWRLMKEWFGMENTFTKVVLDKTGVIQGYGTLRVCAHGKLLASPFYAENLDAATSLLSGLLQGIPNLNEHSRLGFWYPEINRNAEKLMETFSMKFSSRKGFRSQFTKAIIETPHEKVYSLSDTQHQFV